jgi:hypothetical protein
MDEITRPPRKEDLVKLCEELNRVGAKYIVIGGLAMNNLGLVRTTEDVDLLIDSSRENQRRVRQALLILPEKAVCELGADEDLQQWKSALDDQTQAKPTPKGSDRSSIPAANR